MKGPNKAIALACCSVAILFAACSSSNSKSRYPTASSGVAHKLEKGTITEVREVVIDGQATNIGRIVGAGIGTAVGAIATPIEVSQTNSVEVINGRPTQVSTIDSNVNENRAAMAVGGAVGMVVGQKVEKMLTKKKAQELVIELDSGERIVIVQPLREPEFHDQERVQVYTTRMGNSRVFHDDENPYVDPDTNAYLVDEEAEVVLDQEPITW